MNSSKVILDKIISDNSAIIDENLKRANDNANEIIAKASEAAEAKVAAFKSGMKATYDEILRRNEVVSTLDGKKIVMNAKAKAVDNLFAKALDEIAGIDKKKYLAIIENILKKFAEDGDEVIISEVDKGRVTQKFIDDTAKKLGIKLTLSKELGNFHGGVIWRAKIPTKICLSIWNLWVLKKNVRHKLQICYLRRNNGRAKFNLFKCKS